MEYRKADQADFSAVLALIQDTIRAIYPQYYPQGCVDYFLNWHSQGRVSAAIEAGQAHILLDGGELVGTGSQEGDRITTRSGWTPRCLPFIYTSAVDTIPWSTRARGRRAAVCWCGM